MSELHNVENYDDAYATCAETFSTLRVFSQSMLPDEITALLNLAPTRSFNKGSPYCRGKLHRITNGWFYSTEKLVDSKDTRRHIDMILAALDGKIQAVDKIKSSEGGKIDLMSYWVSRGQGGPWLMPDQMLKLARLGISVWWDIYFDEAER